MAGEKKSSRIKVQFEEKPPSDLSVLAYGFDARGNLTATAPSLWRPPSHQRTAPPANDALARPPNTGVCGLLRSSALSSSSAGKLNGSQSAITASSEATSESAAGSASD